MKSINTILRDAKEDIDYEMFLEGITEEERLKARIIMSKYSERLAKMLKENGYKI